MPRHRPYTEIGIRRLECYRAGCTNRATHQWQACADGGAYRPLCAACDARINEMVLRFLGDPDAGAKMAAYRERLGVDLRQNP
jgi:hypothetical protein